MDNKIKHVINANKFFKIPGQPIAYWASEQLFQHFDEQAIRDFATASVGIQTGDNNKFIHFWWEISNDNICFTAKSVEDSFCDQSWFPYNKGGEFRKWYGNDECVIKWKNDGSEIKQNSVDSGHHYQQYADDLKFKPMVTWSRIATGKPAFRVKEYGYLSDMAGFSLYSNDKNIYFLCGFCNSAVAEEYLKFMAPTLNIMTGPVLSLPIIENTRNEVEPIIKECVDTAKEDWDAFETSWGFEKHPLL